MAKGKKKILLVARPCKEDSRGKEARVGGPVNIRVLSHRQVEKPTKEESFRVYQCMQYVLY